MQAELDGRHDHEVIVAVPGRILGVFGSSDEGYEAAFAAVGEAGPFVIRGCRAPLLKPSIDVTFILGNCPSRRRLLDQEGRSCPPAREVSAFVDTGAQGTFIASSLATELELPQINTMKVQGIGGQPFISPVVLGEIRFPGGLPFTMRLGVADSGREKEVVLGMDVIRHSHMVFSRGSFEMAIASRPF